MTATLGAARLRGRVTAVGPDATLDGEVGVDALDIGAFLRLAIGDGGAGASEQLSRGLIGRWRGRIAFQALGAKLGDRIELRPLSGVAQSDGTAMTFNTLSGNLGGGTVTGDLVARPAADAVTLDGRLQLANVDGNVLRVGQLAMPGGRVSAQLALQGTGRSTATLIGSLSGNGTININGAQLTGLDPIAFESAIRASDQGVRDAGRIRDVVDRALATGRLAMPATDFPVSVRAGRARLDSTSVTAGPVQLSVSGGYDLTSGEIDLRTSLVSTVSTASQAAGRPEIRVTLRGTADAPSRDVDVAPLVGWLAVRAIERETQRLDQLDRSAPPMGGGEPIITSTTPPAAKEPEAIPATPPLVTPAPMPRAAPAATGCASACGAGRAGRSAAGEHLAEPAAAHRRASAAGHAQAVRPRRHRVRRRSSRPMRRDRRTSQRSRAVSSRAVAYWVTRTPSVETGLSGVELRVRK